MRAPQTPAMWDSRRVRKTVTCIACGDALPRAEAREYDKHGDRWDRREKTFEYLCKPCYRELTHHSRDGLESLLAAVQADGPDRETFLRRYLDAAERESVDQD